jgi:hypothetical protein
VGLTAAIALVAAAVLAWLVVGPLLAARGRRAALARPLPRNLIAHIECNVPVRRRLPVALRARHDGLVSAFLAEKQFVGCNDLAVTDEMRATVAAQACLLVLGRPGSLYDDLRSILIYPTAFWVDEEIHDDDGLVTEQRRVLSGQAWDSSRIILSWEDVTESAEYPGEGYNLVLHEFAHYLDAEGRGLAPSPPLLRERERSTAGRVRATPDPPRLLDDWSAELAAEFNALLDAVERGEETFLDPYAAEDEAEFFAVGTEEFLERPQELLAEHPRLYRLMREFYGLDPAAW